jgi:cytochrome c-type biogenesis protein
MFEETVSNSAAFIAGLLSFFSPCILPLIPAYFTFITGYSIEELTTASQTEIRKKVILSTLAYVMGFSAVFILMGASASYLGGLLQQYSGIIRIIGGILILLLGIHLTGIFHFKALDFEKRVHVREKPLHFFGTFLIGMAFAAGWSPCIGPLLGSILIIAGSEDTVLEGIGLLALYSAGLALPFMLMSVFINFLLAFVRKANRFLKFVNPAAGVLLIVIGIFLITNKLHILTGTG